MTDIELLHEIARIVGDELVQCVSPNDAAYAMYISKHNMVYEIDRTGTYEGKSLSFSLPMTSYDPIVYRQESGYSLPMQYTCTNNALHSLIYVLLVRYNDPLLTATTLMFMKKSSTVFHEIIKFQDDVIITITPRTIR